MVDCKACGVASTIAGKPQGYAFGSKLPSVGVALEKIFNLIIIGLASPDSSSASSLEWPKRLISKGFSEIWLDPDCATQ